MRNKVIININSSRSVGLLSPGMLMCTSCWEYIFWDREDNTHTCPKCAGMEFKEVKTSLEFCRAGGEQCDARKQTAPKGGRSKKPSYEVLEQAIVRHRGVMLSAAMSLGYAYPTVYVWLKKFHPQLLTLAAKLRKENGFERGHYSRKDRRREALRKELEK